MVWEVHNTWTTLKNLWFIQRLVPNTMNSLRGSKFNVTFSAISPVKTHLFCFWKILPTSAALQKSAHTLQGSCTHLERFRGRIWWFPGLKSYLQLLQILENCLFSAALSSHTQVRDMKHIEEQESCDTFGQLWTFGQLCGNPDSIHKAFIHVHTQIQQIKTKTVFRR